MGKTYGNLKNIQMFVPVFNAAKLLPPRAEIFLLMERETSFFVCSGSGSSSNSYRYLLNNFKKIRDEVTHILSFLILTRLSVKIC